MGLEQLCRSAFNPNITLEACTMRRRPVLVSRQWWLTLTLALLTAALLAACAQSNSATAPATPRTPVNIQLGWVHEYSSSGFYAAEKNGHFAEQNIAATLTAGG